MIDVYTMSQGIRVNCTSAGALNLTVKTINPVTDPLWKQLVDSNRTLVFQSPTWLSVIQDAYEWEACANVIVNNAGEPVAGLPYFRIEDFRGPRLVTVPFSDFCDPIVSTMDEWLALSKDLTDEAIPYRLRTLHDEVALADERFAETSRAKWHRVALDLDEDEMFSRIHSSARRAVRKAMKTGATIEFRQSKEALDDFFRLHLGIRKNKYNLLPQPYRFFELIWERFIEPGRGTLATAMYDGNAVGCTLFLEWQDTMYYKFSASDLGELEVRPTDLVIWESMKFAQSKGLQYFDFGLSDWDQEGLLRFKRKYATEEKTIHFLTYCAQSYPDEIQTVNKLFGGLTSILTADDVPDETVARAGDLMYRFFI